MLNYLDVPNLADDARMLKSFNATFLNRKNSNSKVWKSWDNPKSKISAPSGSNRRAQDIKTLNPMFWLLKFRIQRFFNILKLSKRKVSKSSYLKDDPRMFNLSYLKFCDLKKQNWKGFSKSGQSKIEAFNVQPSWKITPGFHFFLNWSFWNKKTWNLKVLTSSGHSKSNLLASSQPERWSEDFKTFEVDVFGPQTVKLKGFKIIILSKIKALASSENDRWPSGS